jgi:DNA repair exonuclease SbcCD ATPase subunit
MELSVQEFGKWFEKETSNSVKPLDKEATGLIDDVKKKMSQMQEASRNLIKECEREMEKGKAYQRARVAKRLAQFFIDTLDKISFPEQISYMTTESLMKDLKRAISTIERERNLWFQRISPLFIMARRRIDTFLSRLIESTEKLSSFVSERYVKAKTVTDCFATAEDVAELRSELEKIEKEIHDAESAISSVSKEIESAKEKILSVRHKDEMKELTVINRQAQELDRKIKHELRYLQKPFIKLQNLYHSGDVSVPKEEIEKLNEYLARPFPTLAKEEQGYPVCKKILQKINETIEQEKLRIKSSRQKKAQDQINAILNNDVLLSLQQQCKQLYERRRRLLATGNIAAFKNEIIILKTTLKELERQREHLASKLSNLQNHQNERKDKLALRKKELEKTVLDITKKNVRLSI